MRRRLSLPVVAIGGINESNLEYIKKEQVNLVAVVRAICAADNAFAAALKLERQLLSRPSLS